MKKNDLISVIVPIYNVEKYVKRCIETIIKQTYTNIEVILIDDGSTDSSPQICDRYKEIDNRIKVIHKKNGGLSDARNKGIEVANGEYLCFIDGDDFVKEDMISFLYDLIKKYNADISSCSYYNYNPLTFESIPNRLYDPKLIIEMNKEEALEKMFDNSISFGWGAWNKLYKSEIFKKIRYPFGMFYEDVGTTYKTILKSEKVVFSAVPKYYYVYNENSITKTFSFGDKEFCRILMAEQMYNEVTINIDNKILEEKIKNFLCTQYVASINVMIRSNSYDRNIIKKTKKILFKNFFCIVKYGNLKKRVQLLICMFSFNIYKLILKKYIAKEGKIGEKN